MTRGTWRLPPLPRQATALIATLMTQRPAMAGDEELPNSAVEQTAGSHSLAAAAHRKR